MALDSLYIKIKESPEYLQLPHESQQIVNSVIGNCLALSTITKNGSSIIETFQNEQKLQATRFRSSRSNKNIPNHQKVMVDISKPNKEFWTVEEDDRLKEAEAIFGEKDWKSIAKYVGNGRTKSQCSQRWKRTLDPSISKEQWSKEEDKALLGGVEMYGRKSWVLVSQYVGTRSDVQCRYRYKSQNKRSSKKEKSSSKTYSSKIMVDSCLQIPQDSLFASKSEEKGFFEEFDSACLEDDPFSSNFGYENYND